MTAQEINLQDPQVLHRAAENLTDRWPNTPGQQW